MIANYIKDLARMNSTQLDILQIDLKIYDRKWQVHKPNLYLLYQELCLMTGWRLDESVSPPTQKLRKENQAGTNYLMTVIQEQCQQINAIYWGLK